jgi:PKD repeat protein
MKKTLRLVFIVLSLFLQGQLLANTVIVKGTVKDSANHPIVNKTVKIYSTDSTNNGCILSHTVVTNANGYYADTLKCTGDIRKLAIIVESCNGTKITHDPSVPTGNIVESNFVICVASTTPVPVSCKAAFSYTSSATGIKFNGAGSSVVSGDSIISRTWVFGDSTAAVTGNSVDPTHAYTRPGSYNACLTIKTKKGCESSFCQVVVFTPASNDCNVQLKITSELVSNKNFRFNSSQSTTLQGDSIVQRTWKFGDGSSLDGNQVNPLKTFKDTGVNYACLTVRTIKGCEKQLCITVIVHDSVIHAPVPTNCKSQFTFTVQGMSVKFNSANASAPTGDSIVSRIWIFGDTSAQLTGNRVDPSHTYTKAGNYTACLYIQTKSGCASKYCADFTVRDTVPPVPTNCKAYFTYTIKDSTITFNSAGSVGTSADDSIISRTWYYADSATAVSLGGNVIAPSYKYSKPGSYNVYLVIKTKKGCESKYTATVVIPKPAIPTNCKAVFTYTVQNNLVKFTSAASAGTTATDSIISRIWIYGDSSNVTTVQGNIIDPSHVYAKAGKYTVILYIKTKAGCESRYSTVVTAGNVNCNINVQFTAEKISLKKVQFNSSLSTAAAGDSIIQRNWKFGDNTVLSGNEINPVKEFISMGIYNSCLSVRTLNGCEAQACKQVTIQDTVTTPQSTVDYIKIISINPNPVVTRMMTTIFSRNSNVEAELTIYDIYGTRKITVKKLLAQGNNIIEVNTELLYHGQYYLKVSSKNGSDSKAFYKL